MKTPSTLLLLAAGAFALPGLVPAQSVGHYPAGAEGIKGASLPPPGVYLRDYNIGYYADDLPKVALPPGAAFEAAGYVNAPRLIWMTPAQIIGATYGMDIIVPFGYKEVSVGAAKDDRFGLADIQIEPLVLAWHEDQLDLAMGYAVWAPTGDFNTKHMASLGQGFWTHMLTFGGTYFFDSDKTWALSLLGRYEFNMEQQDTHITPGQELTLEWGLSKSLCKTVDAGLIGYYQQQTTTDSGPGTTSLKSRVVGVGPEISAVCPKLGIITSLRYAREFAAEYRPEGNTFTLTVTKRF